MINPNLNVTKTFREQVDEFLKTIFGTITQPYIRATLSKNKTRVLTLLILNETRAEKLSYKVLSCVIYTMIKHYGCIYYLDFQSKNQLNACWFWRGL